MRIRTGLAVVFFYLSIGAFAQSNIIDDSTKQVYGPYTTFFQNFADIKYNKDNLHQVDSTKG